MLSLGTIEPNTLELLKSLMQLPWLNDTRLVGGTALALQYGHRKSIDLDIFGDIQLDNERIAEELSGAYPNVKRLQSSHLVNMYLINGIKVDIVKYSTYKWIDAKIEEIGIRLASPRDIAAMKVNAITSRGSKKDFVDLFFLLKHFNSDKIMQLYLTKYPDGMDFIALRSMTYFEDADRQPMPEMLENVEWEIVKSTINNEVINYSQSRM